MTPGLKIGAVNVYNRLATTLEDIRLCQGPLYMRVVIYDQMRRLMRLIDEAPCDEEVEAAIWIADSMFNAGQGWLKENRGRRVRSL